MAPDLTSLEAEASPREVSADQEMTGLAVEALGSSYRVKGYNARKKEPAVGDGPVIPQISTKLEQSRFRIAPEFWRCVCPVGGLGVLKRQYLPSSIY